MKPVLQRVLQLKRAYARLPFFDHLRDDSLPAEERLDFFPCMAPFVLSFGDLERYVLPGEPTSDLRQRMVNAPSQSNDHGRSRYLEDFVKLGHDLLRQTPTETMRFLWSEETAQGRLLGHRLAHLVWGAQSAVRLAVLEAIEEAGKVLFELTAELAKVIQIDTGTELRYCSAIRARPGSGQATNCDHAPIATIELNGPQREDALQRVDQVFAGFTEWTHELLRFAQGRFDDGARQRVAEPPRLRDQGRLQTG